MNKVISIRKHSTKHFVYKLNEPIDNRDIGNQDEVWYNIRIGHLRLTNKQGIELITLIKNMDGISPKGKVMFEKEIIHRLINSIKYGKRTICNIFKVWEQVF